MEILHASLQIIIIVNKAGLLGGKQNNENKNSCETRGRTSGHVLLVVAGYKIY